MNRSQRLFLAALCAWPCQATLAGESLDPAVAFGARESVSEMTLSPDGSTVAYLGPTKGQGSVLYTLRLDPGAQRKVALVADGKPSRLSRCQWISNARLTCAIHGMVADPTEGPMSLTRVIAVDADGGNLKKLSTRERDYSRGYHLGGDQVIDLLPDSDGSVLMTRVYLPDDHLGSRAGSSAEGLGVDQIDTTTLAVRHIEQPRKDAVRYISDGRGIVRIMGLQDSRDEYDTGPVRYFYRTRGSREWKPLGDGAAADGFVPLAVDPGLDVAYGFEKHDGRMALYSKSLDGSGREELLYARADVDVDELIRIGRRERTVGVSYATDKRESHIFDPDTDRLLSALAKALKYPLLQVVDSSMDEDRMLVHAGTDADPGVYYIFDRKARQLQTFLVSRSELEGVRLADVKAITYPAADGTQVPAYLTLPPGMDTAKGMPAIVLPHGGPGSRDERGFDWLPQYYAARGYAVLQPNFRGSTGYGDAWFQHNGFRSWRTAIGDVLDAGRWLVAQGIADPKALAIVGWSYGGYAALQSAVVDPGVYKAVVAIAPVTDLADLVEEHRYWSDFRKVRDQVGSGTEVHEGSPREHADRITVPVMLFHGAMDQNVSIEQSRRMAARLKAANRACELVTWDDLDHYLDDSDARARMLRESDRFLRQSMGLAVAPAPAPASGPGPGR